MGSRSSRWRCCCQLVGREDGLDGGATQHLAADGFSDPANVTPDPDLEPDGIVVAVITLAAVDAARCDTCKLFEIGNDGTERVAVTGIAVQGPGHRGATC